jgi:diaminopimelate decarboxylase
MELDYQDLLGIELKCNSTGFYIFNEEKYKMNLIRLKNEFLTKYHNVSLGYSYKTNYTPYLCKIAKEIGAYAEVVSYMEYQIAKKIGYKDTDIFFNGPYKEYDELKETLEKGVRLNIDNITELKNVIQISKTLKKKLKVGVRCNFEIEDNNDSRFGIDVDSSEFKNIFSSADFKDHLELVGLHCHFSTAKRTVKGFKERTNKIIEIAQSNFDANKLDYISIGGGFLGEIPKSLEKFFSEKPPSFNDYAEIITSKFIRAYPKCEVQLIIEPGASVVANTFQYYAKVYDIKQIRNKKFVLINGSYQNIKPISKGINLPIQVVCNKQSKVQENVEVVGFTCMEFDRMNESAELAVEIGDYIVFNNVGAYTNVLKAPFIKEQVPILAIRRNKETILIKRRETVDDILSTYLL